MDYTSIILASLSLAGTVIIGIIQLLNKDSIKSNCNELCSVCCAYETESTVTTNVAGDEIHCNKSEKIINQMTESSEV